MWWGWFFWLVIIAVVIWAIVTLVNRSKEPFSSPPQRETALDILKKRYARGDISREEFQEKKKDLEN